MFCDLLTEDNKCSYLCSSSTLTNHISYKPGLGFFFVNHTKVVMIKPYAVQAKVKEQLVLSLRNDEKANKKKLTQRNAHIIKSLQRSLSTATFE